MKRSLAVAIVVTLGLVAAAPAGAREARGPTLRSLQTQITALQKQVKALKKQVKANDNFAVGAFVYSGCAWAVTADALQNTWTKLDQQFGTTVFGAQTPVNDYTACQAVQIVRARTQVPPTTSVFQALLDIFKPSSSAAVREAGMNLASQGGDLLRKLFVLPR
ncbi:MAG TPA: hypothetical protein VGJ27_08185 [Gaiellaceae bacterium]|jgi:hypothetical protein